MSDLSHKITIIYAKSEENNVKKQGRVIIDTALP